MFLALAALNCFHPGRVIQGEGASFPKISRAGKKQQKMLKKMEKEMRKNDKLRGSDQAEGLALQSFDARDESPRSYYEV